jgi:hypothetical protein
MNPNGVTGPIPISIQNANPLLFTFPQKHMNVEPYWIMLLQIITIQTFNRLLNKITVGVWWTTIEIGLICWLIKFDIEILPKWLDRLIHIVRILIPVTPLPTTTRPTISNPRIIAYFIPTYILKIQRGKDVSGIPAQSIANQQENHELKIKLRKLYGKLEFSFTDLVLFCVPLVAHTIYQCQIQSSCMSAEDATIWNCYNAFGYRLYNYVFVSYFHFFSSFVIKCVYYKKCKEVAMEDIPVPTNPSKPPSKLKTWWEQSALKKNLVQLNSVVSRLSLWLCIITCLFVGALLLPYLLTNAIPMFVVYIFMYDIYLIVTLFIIFPFFVVGLPYNLNYISIPKEYRIIATALLTGGWILYTLPILISTTFNYSQYLYYGENYFETMTNEYNSRDTGTFFKLLQNSVSTRFHFSLPFF